MTRRIVITVAVAAALLGAAALAGAQTSERDLARRVDAAPDGQVLFSFAAREGVCGHGESIIQVRADGRRNQIYSRGRHDDDHSCECEEGPVRVALEKRGGAITALRTRVGSPFTARGRSTDLGEVAPAVAGAYLLSLARSADAEVAKQAIFPATIGREPVPWSQLIRLARDEDVATSVRKQAVFWVGQAAADAATKGLTDLVDDDSADRDVRESAVFALSQRPRDESVPALIRVARTNRDPKLRRSALFWLGQSDDPRALALFEELLVRN